MTPKKLIGQRTVEIAAGDIGGQALAVELADDVAMASFPSSSPESL